MLTPQQSLKVSRAIPTAYFPQFGIDGDSDPITFVEHCEEYFALRPLNDYL